MATMEKTSVIQEVKYAIKLEGVSPLVMNNNSGIGEDKGRDPGAYEMEHFRERCYTDAAGALLIPARAIKKALVNACKFMVKKPRGVAFKSYGPFIEAATIVAHDAVLNVTMDKVIAFTTVVNLDPSKGPKGPRGPRTRPMLPLPWLATTELLVFDAILSEEVLAEIAERAGKQVGFLDGRSIDFGRALVSITKLS